MVWYASRGTEEEEEEEEWGKSTNGAWEELLVVGSSAGSLLQEMFILHMIVSEASERAGVYSVLDDTLLSASP